jgi:hypothetical protein
MVEIVTITTLAVVIVIQNILFFIERQKFVDKLMAGSLENYKILSQKAEENYIEEKDDGLIPLEDARDFILEDNAK